MSLIADLIATASVDEVTVRVIACTCPPGEPYCDCSRVRRSTIVRACDAEAMAAVEEARLGEARLG